MFKENTFQKNKLNLTQGIQSISVISTAADTRENSVQSKKQSQKQPLTGFQIVYR